eukprot:4000324-Amphidinium_carterae.2
MSDPSNEDDGENLFYASQKAELPRQQEFQFDTCRQENAMWKAYLIEWALRSVLEELFAFIKVQRTALTAEACR